MFPFHFSFSTLSFSEEQKKTHLTRSTPLPLLHLSFYSLFYRVAARRNHSHSRPIHWDDPLDEGVAGDAEGAAQVRHEPDERGEQVSFFFLFFFFSLSLFSLPSTQKNAPPLSLSKQIQQDRRRRLPPRRKPPGDQRQALGTQRAVFAHGERGSFFFSFSSRGREVQLRAAEKRKNSKLKLSRFLFLPPKPSNNRTTGRCERSSWSFCGKDTCLAGALRATGR